MILISTEELLARKSNDLIPLECDYCKKKFTRWQKYVKSKLKRFPNRKTVCSNECANLMSIDRIPVVCKQCGKAFLKLRSYFKKSPNSFCTRSCAGTYNNTHKTHGSRRSKLESFLERELIVLYPNLDFHFNRKDTINSELDIYIPHLKLAFELNGIFHYEPIYGQEKLQSILNNDQRKFQACLEKGIELCIIDSSKFKHFKPEKAQKYLKIVTDIINSKLLSP